MCVPIHAQFPRGVWGGQMEVLTFPTRPSPDTFFGSHLAWAVWWPVWRLSPRCLQGIPPPGRKRQKRAEGWNEKNIHTLLHTYNKKKRLHTVETFLNLCFLALWIPPCTDDWLDYHRSSFLFDLSSFKAISTSTIPLIQRNKPAPLLQLIGPRLSCLLSPLPLTSFTPILLLIQESALIQCDGATFLFLIHHFA